jgi:hypothetical protein
MNLPSKYGIFNLGFNMDKSCRLYVPFYRYSFPTNGKVQDLSPYGNHGTVIGGPGPWPVPIPGGEELVTNPYFRSGNPPTGWSTANGMESWVGDGTKGTWTDDPASNAYIYQDLPVLENGRRYVLRVSSTQNPPYSSDWFLKVTTAGGDLYWSNAISYGTFSLISIISGNGLPAQLQIGNPSMANAASRRMYIASIRPLLGYESRGWAFDGIDDQVTFGNFSALGIQSEFTILIWVRAVCTKAENDNWGFAIFPYLTVYDGALGIGLYYLNGTTRSIGMGFSTIDDMRWACRAITYKVGDAMRAYLNGAAAGYTGDASAPLTDDLFKIGCVNHSNSPYFRFGELAVFSRAMPPDEIMNYYLQTRHRYN